MSVRVHNTTHPCNTQPLLTQAFDLILFGREIRYVVVVEHHPLSGCRGFVPGGEVAVEPLIMIGQMNRLFCRRFRVVTDRNGVGNSE